MVAHKYHGKRFNQYCTIKTEYKVLVKKIHFEIEEKFNLLSTEKFVLTTENNCQHHGKSLSTLRQTFE